MQRFSKMLIAFIFFILIMSSSLGASAQTVSNGITVTTNKLTYKGGEKIIINGTVEKIVEGTPVTILIRNPIQNVYNVGQVDLLGNVFIHELVISDTSKPGIYIVEIKHGGQYAKLQFIVNVGLIQTIPVGTTQIKVRGEEIGLIKYKSAQVSTQDKSITMPLEIVTVSDSPLMQEFEIPKEAIDAPGQFLIVEVDGVVLNCSEMETNTARILNCFVPPYARVMKITGTSVIPEFGAIAAMILIISMAVVALARIKLVKSFY